MNGWKKVVILTMLGTMIVVSGCGMQKEEAVSAPVVKTMIVGEADKEGNATFSGTVHGYYESPVGFQVGGRITQRYVSAGDRVSAGQPLFKVDSKDAEEATAQAQSEVISAKAQYKLAKSTLSRYRKLHSEAAISDLAMDQTQNQYELAEAQLNQANASLGRAVNNLGFTTLKADRNGIVGSTMYEVGQVVAAGTPVALIVDDSRLDVHISFTEKQRGQYSVGMPCTVTFWALPGVEVQGIIREIAASPNQSTGTYDAKVTLQNVPKTVSVGMTAEVRFTPENSQGGISIPLTAIATQTDKPSVWVVVNKRAKLIPVEVGQYGEDSVQVISGLKKGDCVITAGGRRLSEGEEVRI